MSDKIKIAAVTGPTASGKTALAIALAEELNGEIISCDSMQIYKGMDIGTAKPTREELARVPHHLIDILPPDAPYSCSDYVKDAERAVEDIASRGKLPIFCGGTGLYLDRFLKGGNDDGAACDEGLREELKRFHAENGTDALHSRLAELDPEAAESIHKNNVKRVMRAIEICLVTGEKKSDIDKKNADVVDKYDHRVVTLTFEKSCKSSTSIFHGFFDGFRTYFLYPCMFRMLRNIFLIQPHTEAFPTHKFFTPVIQCFIMGKIKVIDIPAGAYRFMDLFFLFRCWI